MSAARLILIDGTAVLYRSFYAIKGLATRAGRPTNAVFGFIRKLRQIQETWKPTHWSVALDRGLPTERVRVLPEYKAQRPPMPDGLREQVRLAREYLVRADIACMEQEGCEADDLMASAVARDRGKTGDILIATSDKDLFQLVDESVRILPLAGEDRLMGPGEVLEKTGVTPAQIVDWLALTGDSVDNIPGVPGIGSKTAAKLLAEHVTVDALLSDTERVKNPRLRKALEESRNIICRNREVIRLKSDSVLGVEWDRMRVRPCDPGKLLGFLRDLEFESLARELEQRELPFE